MAFSPPPLLFKALQKQETKEKTSHTGEGEVSALSAHEREINHIFYLLFVLRLHRGVQPILSENSALFGQHLTPSSPLPPNPTSARLPFQRALHGHPLSSCRHPPPASVAQHELSGRNCRLAAEKALVLSPRSFEPLCPFKSGSSQG